VTGPRRATASGGPSGSAARVEPRLAEALARLASPDGGLLLDLDGTLVLSEPLHQEAYRRFFRNRGWSVADEVVREFSGRRGHEVFADLEGPWTGEDPHALSRAVIAALAEMLATGTRPEAVPGAAEILAAAARTGLPTAIVTSAGRAWTRRVVGMLAEVESALADAADAIRTVTAEDCTCGKPDPEPYRRGAEALGLDPAGLVAVEDTPAGIASALGAGIGRVIGVTTTRDAALLRRAGAHACIPDLTQLAAALG